MCYMVDKATCLLGACSPRCDDWYPILIIALVIIAVMGLATLAVIAKSWAHEKGIARDKRSYLRDKNAERTED